MKNYKKQIEEYRTYYNRGFIGTLEMKLRLHKETNRNDFLRFVKELHEETKEDHVKMYKNMCEVIRVLIKAFKFNLI